MTIVTGVINQLSYPHIVLTRVAMPSFPIKIATLTSLTSVYLEDHPTWNFSKVLKNLGDIGSMAMQQEPIEDGGTDSIYFWPMF